MSLASTIKTGATALTPVGGSDLVFGIQSSEGNKVTTVVTADTDSRTRRLATFSFNPARPQAGTPNDYTQDRHEVLLKVPRLLANGKITVDTYRLVRGCDVETSAANRKDMRYIAAQILSDPDYDAFWDSGFMS